MLHTSVCRYEHFFASSEGLSWQNLMPLSGCVEVDGFLGQGPPFKHSLYYGLHPLTKRCHSKTYSKKAFNSSQNGLHRGPQDVPLNSKSRNSPPLLYDLWHVQRDIQNPSQPCCQRQCRSVCIKLEKFEKKGQTQKQCMRGTDSKRARHQIIVYCPVRLSSSPAIALLDIKSSKRAVGRPFLVLLAKRSACTKIGKKGSNNSRSASVVDPRIVLGGLTSCLPSNRFVLSAGTCGCLYTVDFPSPADSSLRHHISGGPLVERWVERILLDHWLVSILVS